ncbi:MAG: YfhO family protein [Thermoanaerobaculales bacterium]|nr:YfhO family protein [Thermoanaerobaculales bacterium]
MSLWFWTLPPLIALHIWMYFRSRDLFRFQVLLDIVLAVVLGPAMIWGMDLNPVRCIRDGIPFRSYEWSPHTEYQPTQSDLVLYFHPWWEETGSQLRRGDLPAIHPGFGAGLPLLANGQSGMWAPVMLPVWLHGAERGSTIMAFWKIELAGLGAFLLFLRGWRLRRTAAAAGGIAWAAAPYLIGWLLVPLAWATALLPWLWWAASSVMRGPARRWRVLGVGIGLGWLMGSGLHPETAAIVCGSALLEAVFLHPRRVFRVVAVALVAGVVATLLAWPNLNYISASSRVAIVGDGNTNRDGLSGTIQRDFVRQIVVPAAMGHPGRGDWRPEYPQSAGAAGVGGAVLALLMVGRVRRRYRRLAMAGAAASLLGLVLLVRIPPLDALLVRIPPIDHMTLPRFGVLIPWGAAVLAALALDGALRGRARSQAVRLAPAVMVAAVALWAAPWSLATVDMLLVGFSVTMAVVVGLLRRWRIVPWLVTAELALLAIGINPVASTEDRLPRTPLIEKLVELEKGNPSRVIGLNRALPPNLAPRYGLRDLRALDPLRPEPFARLMGVFGEPPKILGGPLRRAPAGLSGAWGVGLAVTPPGRDLHRWRKIYSDSDGAIWSNPLLLPEVRVVGQVYEEPDDPLTLLEVVRVLDFENTALVGSGAVDVEAATVGLELWTRTPTAVEASVECDGPCLMVVAQPWAPGWRATVDGEDVPLVRTNIAGLGAVSPSGRHRVEFSYHPWSWRSGVP